MEKVKLKDIASFSKGKQINGDKLLDDALYDYINGGIAPSGRWNDYNVDAQTVTISEGGNSCGYVNFIGKPFWCGAHCYYLYNIKGNAKYLYYALKSQQDRLMNLRSGACMPNIKKNDLGEFVFTYESDLKTQEKVVTQLDKLENYISLSHQELKKLDLLVKAQFVEMFGDIISNNKKWPIYKLNDISTSRLGKMLDAKQNTGKHMHPYLANFNVQWFGFDLSELHEMDFDDDDRTEFSLEDGDLLITEGGEVGRCAVWHNEVQNCYFQKAIHRVRCNNDIILPEYLAWWFKFHSDFNAFEDIVGGKATIAHLPGIKLKKLKIVVPDMVRQRNFVMFLEKVDKLKLEVKESLEKLEILKKALLQRYFE